jgi:SAM-dependent methyltransferase
MPFSAEWLDLREPADLAARDPALLAAAAACVSGDALVLDLGSGTGSTARAFAAHGNGGLRWRFLDNDPDLLAQAAHSHPDSETVLGNLADIDALPLDGVGLVTASALLDLMPQVWVDALAARLAQAGVPFYAALNYDGQMRWDPAHPLDADVTAHFNLHQCTDKGIGVALGPHSAAKAAQSLRTQKFDVTLADSPWILGEQQAPLHVALLKGIAEAAEEAGLKAAPGWAAARCAAAGQGQGVIGHTDLLALPPAAARS